MKNYIQPGVNLPVIAAAATASGSGVLVGSLFGVAQNEAEANGELTIVRCGVFDLTKTSTQAWSVGVKVYWNDSTKKCTTADTGNTLIGVAVEPAVNPSEIGRVLLDGAVR